MSNLTAPRPQVNPDCKPLAPVNVTGRIITCPSAEFADLFRGCAILEIESEGRIESYWTTLHISPDGHIAGLRLQKFATGEKYDLPADLDGCDCPDAIYRSEQPSGCKHQQALRQALVSVARDNAPPQRRPGRKTERDDITGPGPEAA
jgi:hypothetical protein